MNNDAQRMQKSIELSISTGVILENYIVVHDKLFVSPWKKLMRSIFKNAYPYDQMAEDLASQQVELYDISEQIDDPSLLGDTLRRYVNTLSDTIVTLKEICSNLSQKNLGKNKSYSLTDYQADVACYQNCVHTYRAIGAQLNEHIKSIQLGTRKNIKSSESSEVPHLPGTHNKIGECETTLVKALILAATTLSSGISDEYPELMSILAKSKHPQSDWEFFFISGGAGLAMRHPECPEPLRKRVLDDIDIIDHQMTTAVENMYVFLDDGGDDIDILPAIGMWVLWNIGQERPSHEESKSLAPAIGLILNKVVTDCFIDE